MTTALVYIGLGGNLGDVRGALDAAYIEVQKISGTESHRCSPWFLSAPLQSSGPDYLNAVACFVTRLSPQVVLSALQHIERASGRERPYRNAPRNVDLDLLLYADQVIASAALTVPHPRMHERAFVLRPLAWLAPETVIPGRGPVSDLLAAVAAQPISLVL